MTKLIIFVVSWILNATFSIQQDDVVSYTKMLFDIDVSNIITMSDNLDTHGYIYMNDTEFNESLDLETIREKYLKAYKIFSWYEIEEMQLDYDQEIIINEVKFYKCKEIKTLQQLQLRMNEVFTEEVAKCLLDQNRYIEIDNVLYGFSGCRGVDSSMGREIYKLIEIDDSSAVLDVKVEIRDQFDNIHEFKSFDFPLVKLKNGKWVFEDFYIFR